MLTFDILGIKVSPLDKLVTSNPDAVHPVLVRHDVRLEQLLLLQQILDAHQVLAIVLAAELGLDLAQPNLNVLDGAVEVLLLRGLEELGALALGRLDELLPQLDDFLHAGGDPVRGVVAALDELLTGGGDLLQTGSDQSKRKRIKEMNSLSSSYSEYE